MFLHDWNVDQSFTKAKYIFHIYRPSYVPPHKSVNANYSYTMSLCIRVHGRNGVMGLNNIFVGWSVYSFSPHRSLALFEQSIVSAPWLVPKALCGSVGHAFQHCKVLTSWDWENVCLLRSVSTLWSLAAETQIIYTVVMCHCECQQLLLCHEFSYMPCMKKKLISCSVFTMLNRRVTDLVGDIKPYT